MVFLFECFHEIAQLFAIELGFIFGERVQFGQKAVAVITQRRVSARRVEKGEIKNKKQEKINSLKIRCETRQKGREVSCVVVVVIVQNRT